jgi:hypothetical protein
MARRFSGWLGCFVMLALITTVADAQTFKPPQKVEFQAPQAKAANLSITMPQTGDQLARLRFSSESATVDATAQRVLVTYTKTGLTVEMVSGTFTQTQYSSPWQARSEGDFKTLSLTFASNGELMSVRKD